MSDNVGLSTPRGSGTSGYVQRNLAHFRPRDNGPYSRDRDFDNMRHTQRKPDQGILEHDRKREVEVKVFELRDKLEEEGVEEEEIDKQCDELRKKLLAEMERKKSGLGSGSLRKNLKMYQVHELADAKIKESERLRQALRISKDYEEGSHWQRQEERLKKALVERDPDNAPPAGAPTGPARDRYRDRERDSYRPGPRSPPVKREISRERDDFEMERDRVRDIGERGRDDSRDRSMSRSRSRSRSMSRSRSPSRSRERGGGGGGGGDRREDNRRRRSYSSDEDGRRRSASPPPRRDDNRYRRDDGSEDGEYRGDERADRRRDDRDDRRRDYRDRR